MSKPPFNRPAVNIDMKSFGRSVVVIAAVIAFLVFIFSSWFTVDTEETAVVLRLGKYNRSVEPGLHFKWPFGIETVDKIPVERQLKQEFGFRTSARNNSRSEYSESDFSAESLMLTGDLNLADVEWVVQYRISDPYKFLFDVRDPESTLRDISEAAMRTIVGDRTVTEVLTIGRAEIASRVEEMTQQLCNEYQMGIKIEQIVLQDVNPPNQVKASFNGVNEAQQEKERLINMALADYNQVIPKAQGQAQETIQQAEGYALERVNRARGEASRFNSVYEEYVKAPEVFRKRAYLETMERIIPRVGQKVISSDKTGGVVPLLNLNSQTAGGKQQ
jgi:membrane protease subunit HflK